MALPQKLQTQFSPEEIQFIAANDPISIIPNFTMEKMDFIQVTISTPLFILHSQPASQTVGRPVAHSNS
jgi:hypothetical protein